MINETIFFIQIFLIIGFGIGAFKLGKEALITWVTLQALIANLFVVKQITLFGLDVTASDAFAIGCLMGLSFLQEYFGQNEAKRATWICFFCMFFFTAVSQLHLLYQPNLHDTTQIAFTTVLSSTPRLLFASMSVFFIVQQFDIYFFAVLKKFLPHASFAWRTALSLTVSQLIDTILFSFVGLYGLVASIIPIIVVSFLIKLIVIFFFTSILGRQKHEIL